MKPLPPLAGIALCCCTGGAVLAQDAALPWWGSDPVVLEQAGIVASGPLPMGDPALGVFAERMDEDTWHYVETEHFRVASSIEKMKLNGKDRARLAPLIERMVLLFPDGMLKAPKVLNGDQYVLLMGWRLEALYAEFQQVLQVTDADFPASRAAQGGRGPYMGDGPYLGERAKYEIVLHADRRSHLAYSKWQMGVTLTDTVRWHCRKPSKLNASIPCVDSDLRQDRWLWPHVVNNTARMMLDGYKFFAYDPPLWIADGIATYFEKRTEPNSWTRQGGEGVFHERSRSQDWSKDAQKLARKRGAPTMAQLMHKNSVGDFSRNDLVLCWSLVNFMIGMYPDEFAAFVGAIKGQLDPAGYPSGKDLLALQRRMLKELWGNTPAQFDLRWKEWAAAGGKIPVAEPVPADGDGTDSGSGAATDSGAGAGKGSVPSADAGPGGQ